MSGVGKIAGLVKKLEVMSTPEWRRSLSTQLAGATMGLIEDGYRTQSDPYGERWASIRRRGRILDKTGWFKSSWGVPIITETGFRVSAGADYASYHQYGTEKITPRLTVPVASRGLGNWRDKYEKVLVGAIRAVMR